MWSHTIIWSRRIRYLHDFTYRSSFPDDSNSSIPMAFFFICCFYRTLDGIKLCANFFLLSLLKGSVVAGRIWSFWQPSNGPPEGGRCIREGKVLSS